MKKFLYPAVLVATLGIGVLLMYSIWGAVAPRTAEQFVQSGKQYYDQKKYAEAAVEFQNALQKDVRDREARFLLAKTYLDQSDFDSAVKQLRTLLEYHPDDKEANVALGNIYLLGGGRDQKFFLESKSLAEKVLEKDGKDIPARILLGNALAGTHKFPEAVAELEKVIAQDPKNTAGLISLGAIQAVQKNFPQAEQAFLKAREIDPKNVSALMSLGGYYQATGKLTESEAMYKEALAASPTNRQVYTSMMAFYIQTRRVEKAIDVLKDTQTKIPTDATPSLMLAGLYRAANRPADAKATLAETKTKFPDNVEVALAYVELLSADDLKGARKEVDAIREKDPQNLTAQVLLGVVQFFSETDPKKSESFATLSAPSIANGRFPQAQLILGKIAALRGETNQALEHYQKSLQLAPTYTPSRLALADQLLKMGRVSDSAVEVQKVLEVQPLDPDARLLKVSVDALQGKFADADKGLTDLQRELPNSAAVHLRSGAYYQLRGKKAEAEKGYLRALQLQPDSEEILQQVAQYYVTERAPDRAIELINTSVPDAKKTASHYELIGLVNARSARSQQAEAAFKKALQLEPGRINSKASLASEYVNTGRYNEALKEIGELLKLTPTNASAYSMQGMIHQTMNNPDAAKESYEQTLKLDPNSFVAANNLAYMLGEKGEDLEDALNYAQTARRVAPNEPKSADTLGWIQHKMGRDVLAREQLLFAVSKQPDNPTYNYHLGVIYKDLKQTALAQTALQKAVASKTDFKEKSQAEAALKELRQAK